MVGLAVTRAGECAVESPKNRNISEDARPLVPQPAAPVVPPPLLVPTLLDSRFL